MLFRYKNVFNSKNNKKNGELKKKRGKMKEDFKIES